MVKTFVDKSNWARGEHRWDSGDNPVLKVPGSFGPGVIEDPQFYKAVRAMISLDYFDIDTRTAIINLLEDIQSRGADGAWVRIVSDADVNGLRQLTNYKLIETDPQKANRYGSTRAGDFIVEFKKRGMIRVKNTE